jgi:hypothetical protein
MEAPKTTKPQFTSESSIIVHPYNFPKANQLKSPTWLLLLVLFIAFFVLKGFIYISDEKRHGK